MPEELLFESAPERWIRGIVGEEAVDIGLGERGVAGVGADDVDKGAMEHEHAQVGGSLQGGEATKQLGGDANDIDEVFALLAPSFQVAKDNGVIAEALPLREAALARANGVRADAQQDGRLSGNRDPAYSTIDEGDDLPLDIRPVGIGHVVHLHDGVGAIDRCTEMADEAGSIPEVVVTQAFSDGESVLREPHQEVAISLEIVLHILLGKLARWQTLAR